LPPVCIKTDYRMEMEVGKIGVLVNTVAADDTRF
jgi:hypothetical protein